MESVEAKFKHGILSIEVPKFENLKKEILVSSVD
jgi:HSP20 family molecular chaperone IbpA